MTFIVTTEYEIDRIAAPSLPLAPDQWDRRYQDQYSNVLRLYFNRLDNFIARLDASTTSDGSTLRFPNGAFHQDGVTTLTTGFSNSSTADIVVASTAQFQTTGTILIGSEFIGYTGKTATTFTGITRNLYGTTSAAHTAGVYVAEAQGVASASTALAIPMDTTDVSNQVSFDPLNPSRIVFAVAGYYNIQFSAQLINFTTTDDNVTFWYRQNGTDIAYSAGISQVLPKHGSLPGSAIISWNIVLPVAANDYIQLMYASTTGNTVCSTYPPGTSPVTPTSPAVILTATFVSALY
jgi:hypothetical protein